MNRRYSRFLNEARAFYKKLTHVRCPVLKNEIVHFDDAGFRHLIVKTNGKKRPIADRIRRFKLLKFVVPIIINATEFENRTIQTREASIDFWAFQQREVDIQITVIVRQVNNGRKHFYSVNSR